MAKPLNLKRYALRRWGPVAFLSGAVAVKLITMFRMRDFALKNRPSIQKEVIWGAPPAHPCFRNAAPFSIPESQAAALWECVSQKDGSTASRGRLQFVPHDLTRNLPRTRFLRRFDFQQEWNNLGYGAFPVRDRFWGIHSSVQLAEEAKILSWLSDENGAIVAPYIVLIDEKGKAILWINREAGPVDGFDWNIVERFLTDYRWQDLGAVPALTEVPAGYDAAFTMRIDCDEAIASGRRLFELYRDRGLPFGIAIKTEQPIGEPDRQLMKDILDAGGSVVTHSHTHRPNWGGDAERAEWEVRTSHDVLKSLGVPKINWDYAVSPFHQNPSHVVPGLQKAGLKAFVGGIICNDPEFVCERAEQIEGEFFTHTQQCMLHGETFIQEHESLAIYEEAFDLARATGKLFGFLDHPLSSYNYGWSSEDVRLRVHAKFLDYLLLKGKVWTPSLTQALDFLDQKLRCEWTQVDGTWTLKTPNLTQPLPWVRYQGRLQHPENFLA